MWRMRQSFACLCVRARAGVRVRSGALARHVFSRVPSRAPRRDRARHDRARTARGYAGMASWRPLRAVGRSPAIGSRRRRAGAQACAHRHRMQRWLCVQARAPARAARLAQRSHPQWTAVRAASTRPCRPGLPPAQPGHSLGPPLLGGFLAADARSGRLRAQAQRRLYVLAQPGHRLGLARAA